MTKQFCDGCGEEITERNKAIGGKILNERLGVSVHKGGHKLSLELLHTTDAVANGGDWCKYCILDAFNKLDDRPR